MKRSNQHNHNNSHGNPANAVAEFTNRLVNEKSPYLLQHAHNPVDWYPWCEGAFEKAREENKPIFLSIGYSTCHWCHVMERESFSDPEVAAKLNEAFVCIKVDREERPDIDSIYMNICQILTGNGGWPLSIFMTAEQKPFFAGTYIPKTSRHGMIGLIELIQRIRDFWQNNRNELLDSADQIASFFRQAMAVEGQGELGETVLDFAFSELAQAFDERHGGFGQTVKFPTPHNFLFLLRYWYRTKNTQALAMVEKSLHAIRRGGIYDHVGFGIHRYTTDSGWLVPHFEKMLYDQAQLSMVYIEAFQAVGDALYTRTAKEILTYVLRDLTLQEGGFYCAEDADSEGEEGKFYLWTHQEIQDALSKAQADLAIRTFNIAPNGNFVDQTTGKKNGLNILHINKPIADLAADTHTAESTFLKHLDQAREILLNARRQRPRPYRDDKILTDWNSLMIVALAKAARVFDEPAYTAHAVKTFDFIQKHLQTGDGRLLHRLHENDAGIEGNLNDYAFFTWAAIELYETTFETRYLQAAIESNQIVQTLFFDDEDHFFYLAPDDSDQELLVRPKEIFDGATPAGNSVVIYNLLRLARLTGNAQLEELASKTEKAIAAVVRKSPSAFTQLLIGLEFQTGPSYEIIIVGNSQSQDTQKMIKALNQQYLPNSVVLFKPAEVKSPGITRLAPFIEYYQPINSKATAYVCQNLICMPPTTSIDEMLEMLQTAQNEITSGKEDNHG
jgi:uncharacterized protein YyaL (SSP411 family)